MQPHRIQRWLSLALVAAFLSVGLVPVTAAPDKAKKADAKKAKTAKKPKSIAKGEYAIMIKYLAIEGDQLAAFNTAVQARNEASAAWKAKHADKLAQLKEAGKSDNADAAKAAKAEMRKLKAEEREVIDAHRDKIFAVLTPDQRVTWQGFNFYRGAMTKFSKAKLTEEQSQKVRALAASASKEHGLLKDDKRKTRDAVVRPLYERIEKEVLTDDQRAALAKPKKDDSKKKPEKTTSE